MLLKLHEVILTHYQMTQFNVKMLYRTQQELIPIITVNYASLSTLAQCYGFLVTHGLLSLIPQCKTLPA